jgi:hemoglobin
MMMHASYLMSATAVFACVLSSTGAGAATLYERLGGYGAIQAVVHQTITNVGADHRINKFFAHADIPVCGTPWLTRCAPRPAAGAIIGART